MKTIEAQGVSTNTGSVGAPIRQVDGRPEPPMGRDGVRLGLSDAGRGEDSSLSAVWWCRAHQFRCLQQCARELLRVVRGQAEAVI